MPDFNLDISRYAKLAIHRSRKQTAHDLREPLLLFSQDTQKRNPTAAMEFIGRGASRAVKYHGFATPPSKISKKVSSKIWEEQII